jgi:nucleotide-binding universal stress UspA family protein
MMANPSVVVGVDGSASSEAACRFAAAEAVARKLPLTLVHAWEPYPVFASGLWSPMPTLPGLGDLERTAQHVLASAVELVAATAPDLPVEQQLVQGPAPSALTAAARGAPLLVVGGVDRGRSEIGWLGAVPLHVAGNASCPVVVVPTDAPVDGDVVVGVDDSGLSTTAIGFAFEQASRWDRQLVAVHAFPSGWGAVISDSVQLADLHERARAELAEALAGWREKFPDVQVSELVSTEHPVRALRCAADTARLLVMGSHGRGAVLRYAVGSISATVLRVAPCAVAVVTPAPH